MKTFSGVCMILVLYTIWVMEADLLPVSNWIRAGSMCRVREKYNETKIIPKSVIVREEKKTFCFSIPPTCIYHVYKIKHRNETITVEKERFVMKCCSGFEKKGKTCVPICEPGCNHGDCIEPNICHCEPGWRGESCTQLCEVNRFGRNCMENCSCENGATCDRRTGHCQCPPGYQGTYCELLCPENTYGQDCKYNCTCENSALCDIKDGSCDCQPGYYGEDCEFRCEKGYHSYNCEQECICIWSSTENCSHIDGSCFCNPGYTGSYCEQECSNLTYGRNCEEHCQCKNAEYCNTATGECYCNAGWMGDTCSTKCLDGYFGDECREKCAPCKNENQTCHHETGECICPSGFHGEFCIEVCPENRWGPECSEECKCDGNSTCDGVTGECICGAGWTGKNCHETCPVGKFGQNCTFDCPCKNCDAATGNCNNVAGQRKDKGSDIRALVIGFSSILFVLLVFAVSFCVYRFGPTIRNWCNSRFARKTNVSTEDIIGEAFQNPIYSSTGETFISEELASYVDITSSIAAKSSLSLRSSKASSCDAITEQGVSGLKRASKLFNLSTAESTENADRNSKDLKTASNDMTSEDSPPEVVSDFNTLENIMGNLMDVQEIDPKVKHD